MTGVGCVQHLFHFFHLEMEIRSDVGREHAALLVDSVVPGLQMEVAPKLADLGAALAIAQDENERMQGQMSLRMMLRVARRTAVYPDDLDDAINMNMMCAASLDTCSSVCCCSPRSS